MIFTTKISMMRANGTPFTMVKGQLHSCERSFTAVNGLKQTRNRPLTTVNGQILTGNSPFTPVNYQMHARNYPFTAVKDKMVTCDWLFTAVNGGYGYQNDTNAIIFLPLNFCMMETIKTLAVTHLLLASHYEFHRSAEQLMRQATAEALHIETLLPRYKEAIGLEFEIISYNNLLTNTQLLRELDKIRGELLSRLTILIDAARYSPIEAEREAGQALRIILSPYRNIARNEYTKETGQLRGLSRDMNTPVAQRHLATLSLTAVERQLSQANIAFADAMQERIATEAARPQNLIGYSTKDQRKAVDKLYKQIIEMVNAYALIAPTEEIAAFISRMNALIDQYKRVLKHLRPGGSGNEEIDKQDNK